MFACSMFNFIATHIHPAMQAGEQLEELRNYSHMYGSVRKESCWQHATGARQIGRNFEGGGGGGGGWPAAQKKVVVGSNHLLGAICIKKGG